MSDSKTVVTFPFAGALAILFIALKLCGVIGWSWWWVLSPIWIPLAICLLCFGVMFALWAGLLLSLKSGISKKWKVHVQGKEKK